MRCPECGRGNSDQRTYCGACGHSLDESQPSHFLEETCKFVGLIGDAQASLDLTISDRFYAVGKLAIEGFAPTDVSGLIVGGLMTLEIAGSVVDLPVEGKDYEVPVRMIPALVGNFEGRSFSGTRVPNDPDAISSFQFHAV